MARKESFFIFLSVILIFLSGTAYSIYQGDSFNYYDEKEYYILASNLSSQHEYSLDGETPTAFRPPGYPIFLSIFPSLSFNIPLLRILNYLLFCVSIYLVYRIVRIHSSSVPALVGVLMVAGYPVLFYAGSTQYPQTLGALLLLTILFLISKSHSSTPINILIGLLFGCLILTIPIFLLTLLVFLFWVYFYWTPFSLKSITLITIPLLIIVDLWTARNYMVFDRFILISTNSGKTFC